MEKRISGHTGLMALFGTPVGHSGSPEMYNFSFQHDGLDYAYIITIKRRLPSGCPSERVSRL